MDILKFTLCQIFRLIAEIFTPERFEERIARLYEQGANINRIGQYVFKWAQWTCAGIYELHKINILATPEIIK